jgi:hypothetical protein
MGKDLPLFIFSQLTNDSGNKNDEDQNYTSFYSKENKIKQLSGQLNFKYLINLNLNENDGSINDNIKCLTQNFYFGDCISPASRLLPCSFPHLG